MKTTAAFSIILEFIHNNRLDAVTYLYTNDQSMRVRMVDKTDWDFWYALSSADKQRLVKFALAAHNRGYVWR